MSPSDGVRPCRLPGNKNVRAQCPSTKIKPRLLPSPPPRALGPGGKGPLNQIKTKPGNAGFAACSTLVYTLQLETCSSETSVDFKPSTWRYFPEETAPHNRRCENLKFYKLGNVHEQQEHVMITILSYILATCALFHLTTLSVAQTV
jgi:hypothetical protein